MDNETPNSVARKPAHTPEFRFEVVDLAEAAKISVAKARRLIMTHGHDRDRLVEAVLQTSSANQDN
jgi:hypothetical protein